jgi:hypothetical protein
MSYSVLDDGAARAVEDSALRRFSIIELLPYRAFYYSFFITLSLQNYRDLVYACVFFRRDSSYYSNNVVAEVWTDLSIICHYTMCRAGARWICEKVAQ